MKTTNRISEILELKFGKTRLRLSESVYKEQLGIPKKTFGKYLNNEVQPRIDEVQRISDWLGVPFVELINF